MPHYSPRRRARRGALITPLLLAIFVPACLVDLDDRCGDHQHYDAEQATCLCDPAYVLGAGACVPCAENEVGSPDGCVCAEGFSRKAPDAVCAQAGLGDACQSDADCSDPSYAHCRPDGDSGYCTASDCEAAPCPGDYACNTREAPSFCERPPLGLGTACSSSDECAGFEAAYCETVVAKSCVVNDCKPDPNKCHGDWVCCDIGLLSQSLCLPPSELEDGNCPAGGTIIPREAP